MTASVQSGLPALRFVDVSQAFLSRDGSEIRALDRMNLTINRGEFLSIVGPSGCGKSTALRLVAGLDTPTLGDVLMNERPVAKQLDFVGMVFQRPTLLHWLTIEQNVLLPVKVRRGRVLSADRDKAHALLRTVGLEQFASKMPSELSGGMQQRAAICRALVQNPDILLMDEPFGALDALTREEMCFELLRIWERTQKTIVFVTHSIPEAVLLSDRVVVMSARPGRISDIVDIASPRPRSLAAMGTPEFMAATQHIREKIYGTERTPEAHRPTL
jgi:NitT/TauT family transport system ATP-binding protein